MAYWVYVMGGAGETTYVGFTNDLMRRVHEHKTKQIKGFTQKYNLDRLFFYCEFREVAEAIAFEKKLKGWSRKKKADLIDTMNVDRIDLAADWYG